MAGAARPYWTGCLKLSLVTIAVPTRRPPKRSASTFTGYTNLRANVCAHASGSSRSAHTARVCSSTSCAFRRRCAPPPSSSRRKRSRVCFCRSAAVSPTSPRRSPRKRRGGARKLPEIGAIGSGHSGARAQPAGPGGRRGMTILPLKRQRFALQRRCRLEKSADQIEKGVEPVMVDPVTGVLERNDLRVAEMASPPVVRRAGGPTLLAVDKEGRAIDALP
jgi:hypothetical protein